MGSRSMRQFWDRRAREDAFHFVDTRMRYRDPDTDSFWRAGERDLEMLLELGGVSVERDQTILEIGCGIGRLTRPLAIRAARVLALDVSPEMLAQAREHNAGLANVTWILGDGTSLAALADATVDACVSHVVFQHIPDPAITLGYVREIGRVLRPGGWTVFGVSNDPRVHTAGAHGGMLHRAWRRLLAWAGRAPRGQHDPAWLGSAVDLTRLTATAAEAGMQVERTTGAGTQFCVVHARRPG